MKQIEWLHRPVEEINDHPYIILDSGAYSVWRSGATVDSAKYLNYCATVKDETLTCVNLDIIPGAWGRRATATEVEAACEASFTQWEKLRASGALIMPVYHQTDDIYWLRRYIDAGAAYIGISPTDSFAAAVRQHWLVEIHKELVNWNVGLNERVFTHGLGVFSPRTVRKGIGLWSADASTLLRYTAIKRILIPKTTPAWDPQGQIAGWEPIYVGSRQTHQSSTNVDWHWVRKYIETEEKILKEAGRDPHWQYQVVGKGRELRVFIDDYCTTMSLNLLLARKAMRNSGVRCFVAGQLPLAIWQVAVAEQYPYILRSYAVIKETHGNTIKKIFNRQWERPKRRPELDRKVEPTRGLFTQLSHSGRQPGPTGVS